MSDLPPAALAFRLELAESNLRKLEAEVDAMRALNSAKERRYLTWGVTTLGFVVVALAGILWKNLPEIIR